MNIKVKVIKKAVRWVVGIGTAVITKSVIENNMAAPTRLRDKITVYSATAVIAAMASESTRNYTDTTIDNFVEKANHSGITVSSEKISVEKDK